MSGRRTKRRILVNGPAVWDRMDPLNLSQNQLADLLGCSISHLSLLLNGKRSPSPRMRQRMQEVLGAGFGELFTTELFITEVVHE